MKIGIEARHLFSERKYGIDFAALELIRALQQVDQENEYYIFVKPGEDRRVIKFTANFRVVEVKGKSPVLWEQYYLPKAVRRAGVDILHCTSNIAPFKLQLPIVVTLHGMFYFDSLRVRKGGLFERMGRSYTRKRVPRLLARCERVLTASDAEQQHITASLELPREKVLTVHHAAAAHFQRITNGVRLGAIKEKYELPDEFILLIGSTDPRKNITQALRAVTLLKQRGQLSIPLVIVNYDADELQKELTAIGDSGIWDQTLVYGYISNQELACFYNLATVFLYPSLHESFGIPILEAMSCGTPVVTSNVTSMPEVAGGAALLADPNQPEEIADAIYRILSEQALYEELMQKGINRASAFTWKAAAEKVLSVYREIGGLRNAGSPAKKLVNA